MLRDGSAEQQQQILRGRARRLAQVPEREQAAADAIEILEFALAGERYGIETPFVREIQPLHELTPVPCTPSFVAGVINVRGELLSVIDVKKFFDLPERGLTELHTVVIVQDQAIVCGILCDVVAGVRRVPRAQIQKGLPTLSGIREQYLLGVATDLTIVLDTSRILRDPKIIVHDDIEVIADARPPGGGEKT